MDRRDLEPGRGSVPSRVNNCYAMRMAARLDAMGMREISRADPQERTSARSGPARVGLITTHSGIPASWKKPRRIFVNSMSDLFHEEVPADFHRGRLARNADDTTAHLSNSDETRSDLIVWRGITVSLPLLPERVARDKRRDRRLSWGALTICAGSNAAVRFVSFEPLLGSVARGPICAASSGLSSAARAARAHDRWPSNGSAKLKPRAAGQGPAFFFKQWGGVRKKRTGRHYCGSARSMRCRCGHRLHKLLNPAEHVCLLSPAN